MSAWEYDAPTTMPPLEGPFRGAGGRLRQKGDDERLLHVSHCRIPALRQHTYSDLSGDQSN